MNLQDAVGLNYAKRLGVVLILGVAALLVVAGRDKNHRTGLESFREPTAVGDQELFAPAEPLDLQKPVASFSGQPLFANSSESEKIRESQVVKVGRTDSGSHFLYRQSNPKKADKLLLKVSQGRFLVVAPR